jgi:hypothetical protein
MGAVRGGFVSPLTVRPATATSATVASSVQCCHRLSKVSAAANSIRYSASLRNDRPSFTQHAHGLFDDFIIKLVVVDVSDTHGDQICSRRLAVRDSATHRVGNHAGIVRLTTQNLLGDQSSDAEKYLPVHGQVTTYRNGRLARGCGLGHATGINWLWR